MSLQLLVCVRLEGGVASPLGMRKRMVGSITSEQWLQRAVRGNVSGGFPWDGHQCHKGLNPAWFSVSWALLATG